jgi:hypothetical protein
MFPRGRSIRFWISSATPRATNMKLCSNSFKSKAIPVTGRGGLEGCEMLRIPNCLDNLLRDGLRFVSPTHRLHFSHFC